jgi:hypothetical protein
LRQACVSSSIAFLVSLFHSIYSVLCHDFSTVAILLAVVVPIYCNFDSVAYACLATDRWWYMQASIAMIPVLLIPIYMLPSTN